jgi:hypothetical protein
MNTGNPAFPGIYGQYRDRMSRPEISNWRKEWDWSRLSPLILRFAQDRLRANALRRPVRLRRTVEPDWFFTVGSHPTSAPRNNSWRKGWDGSRLRRSSFASLRTASALMRCGVQSSYAGLSNPIVYSPWVLIPHQRLAIIRGGRGGIRTHGGR